MLNTRYILTIDSSSSSVEVCLVNSSSGEIEYSFNEKIELYKPKDKWFEHDAVEIWEKQLSLMHEALKKVPKDSIIGIGITNQRETIVAWDKYTFEPIYKAISWQDSRNSSFLERFRFKERMIKDKTGLFLSDCFSVSKMAWILENIPYDVKRIRFGTVDSWLVANLTKGVIHFTDVTNASRTMCMNLDSEDWDKDLLELFGIPIETLPTIRPSGSCFGYWNGIPILGVIGDQQSALLSLGNRPGIVQCTYGTGLFVLQNTGNVRKTSKRAVTTVAWKLLGQPTFYAVENGSFVCGNVLDRWNKEDIISEYAVDITSVPVSFYLEVVDGRLIMFDKRKWINFQFNLDISKERGKKVIRSYLNSLAFLVKELIEGFKDTGLEPIGVNLNGNLVKIDYLKHIQSSVLEKKISIYHNGYSSILGVSLLVLLSKKLINWDDINRWNEYNSRFYYYSVLNSLEISFLSNIWIQYRSEL